MYLLVEATDSLYTFDFATAWDVTSASFVAPCGLEGSATGDVAVRGDGTSLYTMDWFEDLARQYDERFVGTARASVEK